MTDYVGRVQDVSIAFVTKWFEERGWTVTPITGRGDQRSLGDLRIAKDGVTKTIEVKGDQNVKYQSMFGELQVDCATGKQGWLQYCEANLVCYHLMCQGKLYFAPSKSLHRLVFKELGMQYFIDNNLLRIQSQHESFNDQTTLGLVIKEQLLKKKLEGKFQAHSVTPLPRVKTISESHSYAYRKQQVSSSAVVGCESGEFTSTN